MQRLGEIADLARRSQRWPARQIAAGDRLRHVAQLGDRSRYAARKGESNQQRADERDEPRDQHITSCASYNRIELGRSDGHTHGAETMPHGDIHLVVALRHARPHRAANAGSLRL
ncbi:MAG TPA: hypothetical protein VGH63_20315, partial [Polyangia bacterium]